MTVQELLGNNQSITQEEAEALEAIQKLAIPQLCQMCLLATRDYKFGFLKT